MSAYPRPTTLSPQLRSLRGATAITGVGLFGNGETPGYTEIELLAEAARRAVADAGLTMPDIDGICTASVLSTMWPMPVIEYLGINPRFIDGTMLGGSSFIAHLMPAMLALQAGQCDNVLVCYGSTQRSGTMNRAAVAAARRQMDPQPYEMPYDPVFPVAAYALATSAHMATYGTTRRQLAQVAVSARAWAQKNPDAFERGPLTVDDVLKARMVASPLTVRDCCLVTDGAGAFVLQRADVAKAGPQTAGLCAGHRHRLLEPPDQQHARPDRHGRQPERRRRLCHGRPGAQGRAGGASCTTPSPSTPCCSWKTWALSPRAKQAPLWRAVPSAPAAACRSTPMAVACPAPTRACTASLR